MNNHLTFWIPGLRPDKRFVSEIREYLAKLPKNNLPNFEYLNLVLSRSDRITASDLIEHNYILGQLAATKHRNSWPLAEWRLALETLEFDPGKHQWLCADPVYVHPDRAEALLLAHEELEIELDEARQLAELINQHYLDDPWELHIGSSHRWYIKLQQNYDLKTCALPTVKGKNIFDYLPSGDDARYWQQCMNELQMLLHSSDINEQREEKGLMPINSLWLWGYAPVTNNQMEEETPLHWSRIYSDDAVLNGLGVLSGSKVEGLPASLMAIDNIEADTLVYDDHLQTLLQQNDLFGWLEYLQMLEANWFKPLVEQLMKDVKLNLNLLIDNNEAYGCSARQLKRWWRFSNKNKLF